MSILPKDMPALLEKLRIKARAEHDRRISIDKLDETHRGALVRAINNVLSTELAIFTYAQIIDGLPTADVGWDQRSTGLYGNHPLDEHETLCPGTMEKAREICPYWDPAMLAFDPKVVNAFQGAAPGTKMFQTRLIEMVAVALHQLGALLYQLDVRLHASNDVDAVVNWIMPRPPFEREEDWVPIPPRPSIFNHSAYLDADVYPEGRADVVGYWVEGRIFGGVVVFDRRSERDQDENLTQEPPNVYLHPCRANVTSRVTQLLDRQQQALVDFLLAEPTALAPATSSQATPETSCPLPILVDDRNRTRYDAEDAHVLHGIYRDVWERKPLDKNERNMMKRRPQSGLDYPEARLDMLYTNRAAGVPVPEGRYKRYLEGEEDLDEEDRDDGPWKRALDEYKKRFGTAKKVKLEHAHQEVADKEEVSEGVANPRGKEKELQQENKAKEGRERKEPSRWRRRALRHEDTHTMTAGGLVHGRVLGPNRQEEGSLASSA